MISRINRTHLRRWALFLLGGFSNTALTWLLYLATSRLLPYQLAYLFAYVVGIGYSYAFNARFVFRVPLSWRGAMAYPLVYLVQYLASACFLGLLVEWLHLPTTYSPLLVAIVMLPITYVMSKVILRSTLRASSGNAD